MCIEIESLLGMPSRQTRQLKVQLGCTAHRIALLRRKHQVQYEQERADVVQLLLQTEIHRALCRAEQVVKEQNKLDLYNLVETFCNLIIEKALLFDKQMECPDELFEAVTGLIYAAPRCGDLPELRKVRHIFMDKYGQDFTTKCGVNPKVIEIFSRKASIESMKRMILQIASDQGIKLEFGELLPHIAEENQTMCSRDVPVRPTIETRKEIITKTNFDKILPVQIKNMDKKKEERLGLVHDNNSDENMKNVEHGDKLKRNITLSFGRRVGVSVRTRRPGND